MSNAKDTVCVGLSGGVDSSVAAQRLLNAGYNVIGVFIKTWQPDFIRCTWQAERLDAMRVAAHLGIPFYTCDAVENYRDAVAMYMIDEYRKGRTPNPDVMCNKYVKFGTFLDFASSYGATKIATGHYARVIEHGGAFQLHRGVDTDKDQSYFLWTLTQGQLERTIFPVGDTVKQHVRSEAEHVGLATHKKGDSQGVCFLGEIDMKDFLSHYIDVQPGDVVDERGNVIGTHDGALFYTLGQRQGFRIHARSASESAHYVISRDIERNTITAGTAPVHLRDGAVVLLTECNFISELDTNSYTAQFRYRQKPFPITLTRTGETTARVTLPNNHVELPSLGQSCVWYKETQCIGGGIIDSIETENM